MRALTVIVAALGVTGLASVSHAAIYSNSDFAGIVNQTTFTAGTDSLGVVYSKAATQGTAGNPGTFGQLSAWEDIMGVGLAAPASAETWTVSFDWMDGVTNDYWGGPYLNVLGLSNGAVVNIANDFSPSGALMHQTLPRNTPWAAQSFDVNVPAGLDVVLVEFVANEAGPFGVDNLVVTGPGAIPEPASLGLLALAAGGLMLRRRRA